jgi:hypothetical protein
MIDVRLMDFEERVRHLILTKSFNVSVDTLREKIIEAATVSAPKHAGTKAYRAQWIKAFSEGAYFIIDTYVNAAMEGKE